MRTVSDYYRLRRRSDVVPDIGGYDLGSGEANPKLFERLAAVVAERKLVPVLWEPFAGHGGRSKAQDAAEAAGLRLVSFDLEPSDQRVLRKDATKEGPGEPVGGVFFHPPYFGSAPTTSEPGDMARMGEEEYVAALRKVAGFAMMFLVSDGVVCAVGRSYMCKGRHVRMDMWYAEAFGEAGLLLEQVWSSIPDVVMLFGKKT